MRHDRSEHPQGRSARGGGPEVRRRHHPDAVDPSGQATGHGRGLRGHRRGEGRGRGRAQRGDVRSAVLLLLADQPMHGYQLMQAIVERTDGAWRPSPGAIYPTIAQLEDEGLVTVTPDSGRKLVALTEAGRAYLTANVATLADPFTAITVAAGGHNDLRGSIEQLHLAARAVAQTGTDAQIAAAQEILAQARRSLYLILADGVAADAVPADEGAAGAVAVEATSLPPVGGQ